jgi:hypothetical protein
LASPDFLRCWPTAIWLGELRTWASSRKGTLAHGQESVRLAEALDHPYSLTFASWALGYFHIIRGELGHAVALLERGVAVSREWNLTLHSVQNTGLLGYAYALSERIAEGIPLHGARGECQ